MSARIAVLLGVIALIGITVGGGTALGRSFVAERAPLTSSLQVNSDRLPISVQGVITDNAGSPVADGGHQITFSIYDGPDAGTRLWQESQTAQTSGGLFSVLLGQVQQIDPSLFTTNAETYLGIKVGENSELTPRLRLAYVPYAMHSLTAGGADTLAGLSSSDLAKVNHTHAQSGDGFGDSLGFFFSPFSPVTVDVSGKTGTHSSIAIGLDSYPIISYYNETRHDLMVAHCLNLSCTETEITTVDDNNRTGQFTSTAIGKDGLPVISYVDDTKDDLKVARCADVTCSSAALTTVDRSGKVGKYSSITIGADGLPIVSYFQESGGDLKVVHCSKQGCAID